MDVPVRWIVGGDVARIANLVNYKPYAPTGNVIVDIEYTGTPPSINPSPTNDSTNTKSATIYFTLQEEDGAALGETHTFQIPIYI